MSRILFEQGHVLTLDPSVEDLSPGDVLVVDGRIAEVAPRVDVEDCERIDARGCIVLPGFVDTHRHMWQTGVRGIFTDWATVQYMWGIRFHIATHYTAEDTYTSTYVGALECLNAGVTTVADYAHNVNTPDDAHAGVKALQDARIRAVYGIGLTPAPVEDPSFKGAEARTRLVRELADEYFSSPDALVQLGVSPGEAFVVGVDEMVNQFRTARELGATITLHANAVQVRDVPGDVEVLAEQGLLGDDLILVHCQTTTPGEWAQVAEAGTWVSVETEVEMGMALGPPVLVQLREHGIPPTLGIDSVGHNAGDMFGQMRLALQWLCMTEARPALSRGLNPVALTATARDALRWGTINGARALGLDGEIGSLTPGKRADVVMVRADGIPMAGWQEDDPAVAVVAYASPADVDTVLIGGRPVKRGGRLVDVDVSAALARINESKRRIAEATRTADGGFIPSPVQSLGELVPLADPPEVLQHAGRP